MEAICSYDSDSSENSEKSDDEHNAAADLFAHLKPVDKSNSVTKTIALNSTPAVVPTVKFALFTNYKSVQNSLGVINVSKTL